MSSSELSEITEIIAGGESESVEFKKSTSLIREGIETLCAFANHKGGRLFFGIHDNGTVLGQQVADDTLKNLANAIKLNTDPKLYPRIEKITIDEKTCILVTIEESPLKPHLAYGRAFIRVGAANQRLDREHYEYLLQQRFNGYGFDYQTQPRAGIDDLDLDTLYEFLETANSVRNLNANLLLPVDVILHKLDLLVKSGDSYELKKAAVLLFGKEPQKFFPHHFEVKCGKFVQDSGYDEIANEQEFKHNLIRNCYAALSFILESINKTSRKNGVQREERYEFPVEVLREALVNMLVHRDYRQDIKSTIEIRPGFISFYNPAHLFSPTITIEKLQTLHPSKPGNKLIANIFYLMGFFENWGGGTLKILTDTVKAGKPSPEFSFDGGMFRLVLWR